MALLIPPEVSRQMASMPKRDRDRLVEALRMVAAEPDRRFPFVAQMVGEAGVWRLRKGDWRAVYRVVGADVVVERVGHRKEVYR